MMPEVRPIAEAMKDIEGSRKADKDIDELLELWVHRHEVIETVQQNPDNDQGDDKGDHYAAAP
jgi:hypothetical protein